MRGLDEGDAAGRAGGGSHGGTGMPGPVRTAPPRAGGPRVAGVAAVAGLAAAGLFMAACSTGGTGSRDEGAARPDASAATVPTPPAAAPASPREKEGARVDPIALLKADPKIDDRVKDDLKPCVADAYPVDTSYGNLTGGAEPDVVVNVMTCGDAVGIGTYVYRRAPAGSGTGGTGYENVFTAEDAAVYGTIDRGDLIVTKQVYAKGDSVAYPSGEDVLTYRWAGTRFTQHDLVHNEYSRAVGEEEPTAEAEPVPRPSVPVG
ncbi:hypothetical protein ACIQRS_24180 [Streptomyces termitum]|uniref:Lipoprotein CseA n=1 Tax=Streptomyces termitum TaxID=67368 RepID=A0A918WBJ8_9ACTN|nr:lipoprotein CseA [Streptomyces termitum]